jgi:hypothetical protein
MCQWVSPGVVYVNEAVICIDSGLINPDPWRSIAHVGMQDRKWVYTPSWIKQYLRLCYSKSVKTRTAISILYSKNQVSFCKIVGVTNWRNAPSALFEAFQARLLIHEGAGCCVVAVVGGVCGYQMPVEPRFTMNTYPSLCCAVPDATDESLPTRNGHPWARRAMAPVRSALRCVSKLLGMDVATHAILNICASENTSSLTHLKWHHTSKICERYRCVTKVGPFP